MTSTQTAPRRHLPFWSKLLITFVVLAQAGIFAGGMAAIIGIKQVAKRALDPVAMAHAAHDIGAFPEPLPNGYRYVVAVDLKTLGLDIVTIEHNPEKQLFTFMQNYVVAPQDDDKSMLDHGYSYGLNMLVTSARFVGVKQSATLKLAGHEMPYIIGDTINNINDKKGQGMVGCLQLPVTDARKNILIYALQTTDVPYNQQITLDLLNSIKSF